MGSGFFVINPEEGNLLLFAFAKFAGTAHHNRAESSDFGAEDGGALVIVDTLFEEIDFDIFGGKVGIVESHFAINRLIEDVVVVEDFLALHDMGLIEVLIGIARIFVSLDFVAQDEVEQIDKKIFTPILWKDGIVKRCIGIFAQVHSAVDVATPHHVLRHCSGCGKLADRT